MILSPTGGGTRAAALLLARMRWNQDLIGAKNGIDVTYTTPDVFVQSGDTVIRVFRNGQRLREGASNDFTVSESGGVGTGFDTVTFNGDPPLAYENLTADYLVP